MSAAVSVCRARLSSPLRTRCLVSPPLASSFRATSCACVKRLPLRPQPARPGRVGAIGPQTAECQSDVRSLVLVQYFRIRDHRVSVSAARAFRHVTPITQRYRRISSFWYLIRRNPTCPYCAVHVWSVPTSPEGCVCVCCARLWPFHAYHTAAWMGLNFPVPIPKEPCALLSPCRAIWSRCTCRVEPI